MTKRRNHSLAKILSALAVVLVSMGFAQPAQAAMQGYDISNWQCGINTAAVPGDFVVVGSTWGTGQANNPRQCLTGGVNRDANRMIAQAQASGKKIGIYHYAMGGNPVAEADFFIDNNAGYIHRAALVLDWESGDNPAFGNKAWPRQWAERVKQRTGVNPVIYLSDSAYWQVAGMEQSHNTAIWIAQYASMAPTGYQNNPWNSGARGESLRQYSSNGHLPGWGGALDVDIFYGSQAAWDRIANPTGQTSVAPAHANHAPHPAPANGSCVVAVSGDTLSAIAAHLGASWTELTGYKSGNPNLIYAGETICKGAASAHAPTQPSSSYVVQRGDYLSKIWPSSWQQVATVNGLRPPYIIYPGQVLRTTGAPAQQQAMRSYRVQRGDTLSTIAARLGVSVSHMVKVNGLGNPHLIYAGTWLKY